MKTEVIIASHRRLAEGIMDSLKVTTEEQDHVEPLCIYIDRSVDYSAHIRQLVTDHDYEKQTPLVITGLSRDSVNNEFMRSTKGYPFYLVSKLSFSLLLELALYPDELKSDTIQEITGHNSDYIVFYSGDISYLQEESDLQEGEHMIKMLRVDHRLLRGQAAFPQTGYLGVDCILIANGDCVTDDLHRTTLRPAKPPSYKLIVKGTEESVTVLNSGKVDKYDLSIVVDNIADAYHLTSEVDRIYIVNIGGLKAGEYTYPHPPDHNISSTDGEETILRELADKNIDIELRMVSSDPVRRFQMKERNEV